MSVPWKKTQQLEQDFVTQHMYNVQYTVKKSVWDPDAFFGRDFKVGLDRISNSM